MSGVDYQVRIKYVQEANVSQFNTSSAAAARGAAAAWAKAARDSARTQEREDRRVAAAKKRAESIERAAGRKTQSRFGKGMGALGDVAGGMNAGLDSLFGTALSAVGTMAAAATTAIVTGFGAALKEAFKFNEEMENTRISLAAISQASGFTSTMGGGFAKADEVIKEMRKDAAKLPGEFGDLQNILATIASPGAQAGKSLFDMEKLAAQTMASAAVLRVPMNVAAREMAMMLDGNARHSMPLFARLGLGDAKSFNALTPEKRFESARTALGKLDPAIEYFKNSWTGIKSTMIDNMKQAVGYVGGPLFDSAKRMIAAFNEWGSSNQGKLREFGTRLGEQIDGAFYRAKYAIQHWYPVIQQFGHTLYEHLRGAFDRLTPILKPLLGHLENFMNDPKAFDKLEKFGVMMLAARGGGAAVEAGAKVAPGMLKMASSLGIGGAALAEAVVPLVAVLGLISVAAAGAVSAFTDVESELHDMATSLVSDIGKKFAGIMVKFQELWHALSPITESLGVAALSWIDLLSSAFLEIATVTVNAAELIRKSPLYTLAFGSVEEQALMKANAVKQKELEKIRSGFEYERAERWWDGKGEGKDPKAPKHVTNVTVKIEVNSNQDPNRIARLTSDHIKNIAKNPTQSPNHPNMRFVQGVPY